MRSTQPRKAGQPCPPPPPLPSLSVAARSEQAQQRIWSSGDYNQIAAITVPVSEALVARADVRPGERVLDVATGTGHAALAAARRGGRTTGIDYVPELVDIARRRASAEALDVDFLEGDAEALPFPDALFDVVVSAIGVMFTADHERAASELVRVSVLAGGSPWRAGLRRASSAGCSRRSARTSRRRPWPAPDPVGRPGDRARSPRPDVVDVTASRGVVRQRFSSPESFADTFLTHYGPTHTAASRLTDDGRRRCATTWSRSPPTRTEPRTARSTATGSTSSSPRPGAEPPPPPRRRIRCTTSTPSSYVPSSLDVSRAAAERHAITSALQERGRPRTALPNPRPAATLASAHGEPSPNRWRSVSTPQETPGRPGR